MLGYRGRRARLVCVAALAVAACLAGCSGGAGGSGVAPHDDHDDGDSAPQSLVVWFEQPTIGSAPDFFATQYRALAAYLTGTSQQDFTTHRVVVRVLDPQTTWTGGQQPWRVEADAEFVADLMCKLPAGYELFVLPSGAAPWTYASNIADPIGRQMYWVQQINAVAAAEGCAQVSGFVLDPDGETAGEKEALIDEMNAERPQYLPAAPAFKVGMTFGADSLHKSLGYLSSGAAHPLDEAYIEVYNIYTDEQTPRYDALPNSTDTIYTEHHDDPAGVFSAFQSLLSAEPNLWGKVSLDADTAARVVLLFSVENIDNGNCIAPNAGNGKCGQIDAFGTWELSSTLDFLDTFAGGQGKLLAPGSVPVPETNFGIFQYNFLPAPAIVADADHTGVAFFADGLIVQEYSNPGQVDFTASGLDYVLQCDATKPLPATSGYCAGTGLPWRASFYLPGTTVPSPAAVAAVVPESAYQ